MREDYMESLDKMFPGGYAIAYTNPNGIMRFSHFDPTNKNGFIQRFWELAQEIAGEQEDNPDGR